jgi:L-ascorbate metabolism protein UlaG (beta-lactamase superfamily)
MPIPCTPPAICITHVGGPTAIIVVAGLRFLTDPTFSPPDRFRSGPVTLEKTEGPRVQAADVGQIDAVLLSHDQHADNLDPAGRLLIRDLVTLTTVAGERRLGGRSVGLAPWEWREFAAPGGERFRVTATPARHGPAGIESQTGDVIGFVISASPPGRDLVYVTGDTVWFEGTAEVAKRFDPSVVLAFAGAARTTRGPFHLTMDTNDVLDAAAAFPRAAIVPVHDSGWTHFTQSDDDLARAFTALNRRDRLRLFPASGTIEISGAASRAE